MSSLKEQNGRYYQEAEVVIIASTEKAPIFLFKSNGKINSAQHIALGSTDVYQHLYITSNEEIKEGDWFINLNRVFKCSQVDRDSIHTEDNSFDIELSKKIIATTDESLFIDFNNGKTDLKFVLPKPSDSFISKYIEEYNKGNIITKVLVEYEDIWIKPQGDELLAGFKVEYKLKVDSNNTITIKKVKDSYSREEVTELCEYSYNAGFRTGIYIQGGSNDPNDHIEITDWIKENL